MASPACPKCGRVIPPDDINVASDVAYCRACNVASKLSALARVADLETGVDFRNPPAGVWRQDDGLNTVIGSTHRSVGAALGLLGVSLFWNGIVSVFVLLASAATMQHLGIPVPQWFPSPVMNDSPMSVGMTIFLWIFLTPFMAIGAGMIGALLMTVAGRTEVSLGRSEASVFSGVGSIGYRRRFDPQNVTDVRIEDRQWRDGDGDRQRKTCIIIQTQEGKQVKCGTMLTEERRKFIAASMRKALIG